MKKKSNSTVSSNNKLNYKDKYEGISKHEKYNPLNRKTKYIMLSRGVRWLIFIIFVILGLLMNFDHGSIPASTSEIKITLDIDDKILGIFGSLVFLGNLIGTNIVVN
jgi:hypothetical protein